MTNHSFASCLRDGMGVLFGTPAIFFVSVLSFFFSFFHSFIGYFTFDCFVFHTLYWIIRFSLDFRVIKFLFVAKYNPSFCDRWENLVKAMQGTMKALHFWSLELIRKAKRVGHLEKTFEIL